jgi:iron complex outermembrane receptor protein
MVTTLSLAQSAGSINGTVKTSEGTPAPYVNISLQGTSKGSVADINGNYRISNVAPGSYKLVASYVGLEKQEQNIEVKAGEKLVVNFSLKESAHQLQEIVVSERSESYKANEVSTSLRLTSPLIETPQNIQVVTGEVLKDQQIISMSDGLIRNVSGTVRSEHWGDLYANIAARGSQIQAFRNGFNIVNSYWGPLTEDMSFVDHIEFVKGPAGFMLSSGDPSGLYNVVTKKPTGRNKGEATITTGSYGLFRTTLDLDGKVNNNGKLLYRLNLSAQNKNSFRPNEYNDRYVVAPVLSYQVDDKTKLTLEYNYQRANMSNVGSFYVFSSEGYDQFPVDYTTLPGGTPGTRIDDHSFYVNLRHELTDKWTITGQAGHFVYNQIGTSMWPGIVNQDGTYIRNIGVWDANSKMTMAQMFLNGDFNTGVVRHRVLAGVDIATKSYMADWGQSHDLDTPDKPFDPKDPYLGIPSNGFPDFDRTTPLEQRAQSAGGLQSQQYSSLYVQDELSFIDNRLRLTLAGRYTDLKQAAWGGASDKAQHFTPRFGLSGSINANTSMYALYDQAFIPQTGILRGGGKVQPITGNNLEIGIKRDWFGGWNTTVSVYRILKNNELTGDPTNPNSGLSVELGQKRSQGVEFDLRGSITRGLNLIANYAYTDSRVLSVSEGVTYPEAGSLVPGFAKHTFNTWLSYEIQGGVLKGTGVSLGYTALVDRATYWEAAPDPNKEMGDYFKVDGGLFWQKDRIRITANIFNLLDERLYSGSYESWMADADGNAAPLYSWQREAPRSMRFSLAYRF